MSSQAPPIAGDLSLGPGVALLVLRLTENDSQDMEGRSRTTGQGLREVKFTQPCLAYL